MKRHFTIHCELFFVAAAVFVPVRSLVFCILHGRFCAYLLFTLIVRRWDNQIQFYLATLAFRTCALLVLLLSAHNMLAIYVFLLLLFRFLIH